MKKLNLLLLFSLLALFAHSQTKTDAMLFGHIIAIGTDEHIPFASVGIIGTRIGTAADASGHFKLSNLPLGKQIIMAKAVGYKEKKTEVYFEAGKVLNVSIELEKDVLNLEQVVITSTRTQHYIKDVPVRTEVITAKAIEDKNAINLYQALDGTPGIRVESQCQYCNFTMIRMQGLGAEHTQVLIDGQPMYSGLAGVYGLQQMSTVDIDKIEVVKGAGSALYGSGSVAGAINIISKGPSNIPSTTIDAQFGNYKTNKFDISSSLKNDKGNIGVKIFAQRYSEGAIDETGKGTSQKEVHNKDGVSDRVMSNLTNAGFGLYIDNAFLKNDKLIVRGKSVFENRAGGTMTDDYFRNPLTDGTENITTDRYETSLSYAKPIKSYSEINFSIAYVNHNRNATNDSHLGDYMSTHNDSIPDLRIMRPYLAKENSITSTLSFSSIIGNHNIIAGVQGFYDYLEESGMYVVVDTTNTKLGKSYRSVSNKSAKEFGLFVQDEWNITKKLVVVPGVRLDYHHSEEEYKASEQIFTSSNFPKTKFEETPINPRIAIKYGLNDRIAFRANVGTGFRAPFGFSEDLHLCSGSPRVWKSSDLKPETSLSYNFSTDYYGKHIKAGINIFRTDLKNKIGFTDAEAAVSSLGYDYQWKNIDNAFVQGVELSFMANIVKNLGAGIDFTLNQGEYKNEREDWAETKYAKDSKYISRFPMTTGNLKIEYTPKTWTISLIGNYQGNMYIDYYNEEIDPVLGDQSKIKKTDPFMLFNTIVAKKIKNFKLYASVNNILNYVQDEKHLDDAAFIYGPVYGTMFYGGITININH